MQQRITVCIAIALLLFFVTLTVQHVNNKSSNVTQTKVSVTQPDAAIIRKAEKKVVSVTFKDLSTHHRAQVDCLAANIYFEARSESKHGQRAVALVTMNRSVSDHFPDNVCAVVKQQRENVCQFSWWCDQKLRMKAIRKRFDEAIYYDIWKMAFEVYMNYHRTKDITGGALFYHATYVTQNVIGVRNLKLTAKIGQHIFYGIGYDTRKSEQHTFPTQSSKG